MIHSFMLPGFSSFIFPHTTELSSCLFIKEFYPPQSLEMNFRQQIVLMFLSLNQETVNDIGAQWVVVSFFRMAGPAEESGGFMNSAG
jgi:hypothetical protein